MPSCAAVGIQLLGRHVPPLLSCVGLRSLVQPRSPSVLCRSCISLWLNQMLNGGLCLSFLQGLPHLRPVRLASGQRVCSFVFCCYRFAHVSQVCPKAFFCVTAGLPRMWCTAQALPEPSAAGPAGPDITLLRPQLQKQWHHANNRPLGNIQIQPGSGRLVWWTCDRCPSGLPHEWRARVYHRQGMDTQCPFCTNRSLCHHNSLLTVAPSVASYWDTAKNGVTADQVLAGSHTRRHWLCPTCGHSWQAPVETKVGKNSGCPKCSRRSMEYTRQPTLTASNHPVMLEFDHHRNQEAGLHSDEITLGSDTKVHWVCSNCHRGQPHLYMASPNHRVGKRTGCPYCSCLRACICNSLQSLYPVLAAEWDTARNVVGPDHILPGSHKLGYWKNAFGHSWKQSPNVRTNLQQLCAKRALVKAQIKQQQA